MILAPFRSGVPPVSRLLAFPHAGAGAGVFRRWRPLLPADVELVAVGLPGRGERFQEPPHRRVEDAVAEVERGLAYLPPLPLVLYGHSMGAVLALELAHRVAAAGAPARHLVVAARRGPDVPDPEEQLHRLDDAALVARLGALGGTPEAILCEPDLLTLLLPSLRADLRMLETWSHPARPPLATPITAIGGLHDPMVPSEHLEAWRASTAASFRAVFLDAGHFFTLTHSAEVVRALVSGVLATVAHAAARV